MELAALGEDTVANARDTMLGIITSTAAEFTSCMDGTSDRVLDSGSRLIGGARVHREFRRFAANLNLIDFMQELMSEDVDAILSNASGTTPSLFIPDSAFRIITCKYIKRYLPPPPSPSSPSPCLSLFALYLPLPPLPVSLFALYLTRGVRLQVPHKACKPVR